MEKLPLYDQYIFTEISNVDQLSYSPTKTDYSINVVKEGNSEIQTSSKGEFRYQIVQLVKVNQMHFLILNETAKQECLYKPSKGSVEPILFGRNDKSEIIFRKKEDPNNLLMKYERLKKFRNDKKEIQIIDSFLYTYVKIISVKLDKPEFPKQEKDIEDYLDKVLVYQRYVFRNQDFKSMKSIANVVDNHMKANLDSNFSSMAKKEGMMNKYISVILNGVRGELKKPELDKKKQLQNNFELLENMFKLDWSKEIKVRILKMKVAILELQKQYVVLKNVLLELQELGEDVTTDLLTVSKNIIEHKQVELSSKSVFKKGIASISKEEKEVKVLEQIKSVPMNEFVKEVEDYLHVCAANL